MALRVISRLANIHSNQPAYHVCSFACLPACLVACLLVFSLACSCVRLMQAAMLYLRDSAPPRPPPPPKAKRPETGPIGLISARSMACERTELADLEKSQPVLPQQATTRVIRLGKQQANQGKIGSYLLVCIPNNKQTRGFNDSTLFHQGKPCKPTAKNSKG